LAPRRIDDKEADRRLALVLAQGTRANAKRGISETRTMSRFELADTLRSETLARLPKVPPWTRVLDPTVVASSLESYLVQQVPANPPDYERLREYQVDAIVEIVVEEYGMRSEKGKAGVYVLGFARMFRLDGGELYSRRFVSDELRAGLEPLDPFQVARDASLFAARLEQILVGISDQVAKDLTPLERPSPPSSDAPARRPASVPSTPPPEAEDPL
jgi:hypothetical protein